MSETRISSLMESYAYLWDGSSMGWVLVSEDDGYIVFNEKTRAMLAVDDDCLHHEIVSEMRKRNTKILESIPAGEFDPNSLVIE